MSSSKKWGLKQKPLGPTSAEQETGRKCSKGMSAAQGRLQDADRQQISSSFSLGKVPHKAQSLRTYP